MSSPIASDVSVGITCFGDGATSQGDVNEAMVFAASFHAPLVLFYQNNQYAISEPVSVQTRVPIALRPTGFGIPALRVDGNDVLAVRAACRLSVDRARRGGGPTFIEAVTYRMGPHTTSDDPTRYRGEAELAAWQERSPLRRVEQHLARLGAPVADIVAEARKRAEEVAAELRETVAAMAPPPVDTMFDHVYTTEHAGLARQRRHRAAFAASIREDQP